MQGGHQQGVEHLEVDPAGLVVRVGLVVRAGLVVQESLEAREVLVDLMGLEVRVVLEAEDQSPLRHLAPLQARHSH